MATGYLDMNIFTNSFILSQIMHARSAGELLQTFIHGRCIAGIESGNDHCNRDHDNGAGENTNNPIHDLKLQARGRGPFRWNQYGVYLLKNP